MLFEKIKYNDGASFYPIKESEIQNVEKELDIIFPLELRNFYLNIGYGFLKNSEYNINRIMDPESVRDFRLRKNDFEFYPDIEVYNDVEDGKVIFYEVNESTLISIELCDKEKNKIYLYNIKISDSLEEFLDKMLENDSYYLDILDLE